ncbi:MAG: GspH/FimT family pseudopilin [Acidobacteriota bacterium]
MSKRRTTERWCQRRFVASAAFSLVELLVALAIIAILSGLGAASYSSVTGRTRVIGEANDLLLAIELTRSEAVKRSTRVTLLPVGADWSAGWTVFVDSNGNRQVDPREPLIYSHARLKPSTRVTTNTTPGYIAFGPAGVPQQYSGAFLAATLTFCDTGVSRSVVLARSGRPRVVSGTC